MSNHFKRNIYLIIYNFPSLIRSIILLAITIFFICRQFGNRLIGLCNLGFGKLGIGNLGCYRQRYLQNVNNFVLVVFNQLIPVILSADKMMKRQRMILFPRASSKTFNQIFISVYMYFDYWSLAYLCFFLQVPSPFFFLLKYYCDLISHKWQ
jgi:hypothetical protein